MEGDEVGSGSWGEDAGEQWDDRRRMLSVCGNKVPGTGWLVEKWLVNWQFYKTMPLEWQNPITRFTMQWTCSLAWQGMLQHWGNMPDTGQICLQDDPKWNTNKELWHLGGGKMLAGISSRGTEYKSKNGSTKQVRNAAVSVLEVAYLHAVILPIQQPCHMWTPNKQKESYGWVLFKVHLHHCAADNAGQCRVAYTLFWEILLTINKAYATVSNNGQYICYF